MRRPGYADPARVRANLGLRFGPKIEIVRDPRAEVERVVDELDGMSSQPTPWMQRLRGQKAGLGSTAIGRAPEFHGRTCCYEHLRPYEGRFGTDLPLPFETTCPTCRREFRVTLDLVQMAGR